MTDLVTNIATSTPTSITVRGSDLVNDLIGRYSFTEMFYFLVCGRMPTKPETRVLDACLVTLMEHGFTPASTVTRLIQDSVPGEVQVAVASGLLAVGSVFAGTMEGCAKILQRGIEAEDQDAFCRALVSEYRTAKKPIPGFGHAYHKPDDPRTPRLFAIAAEEGLDGRYIALLKRLSKFVDEAAGRHLTINATGAIGAMLLEIGVPPEVARGVAVVSRSGGLVGHIVEEQRTRSAREIIQSVKDRVPYRHPDR